MSPVDLIDRNGPYLAGPSQEGEGPANQDPRQTTAFCAAWTLAALAQIFRSATTSATFFDLVGPRGLLIDPEHEFPVADLLVCLAGLRSCQMVLIRPSDTGRVATLAFRQGDDQVFLIGNLTQEPIAVWLPSAEEVPGCGVVFSSTHSTDRIA